MFSRSVIQSKRELMSNFMSDFSKQHDEFSFSLQE